MDAPFEPRLVPVGEDHRRDRGRGHATRVGLRARHQRRLMPRMLRKKLASTVSRPRIMSMAAGTTSRMVDDVLSAPKDRPLQNNTV